MLHGLEMSHSFCLLFVLMVFKKRCSSLLWQTQSSWTDFHLAACHPSPTWKGLSSTEDPLSVAGVLFRGLRTCRHLAAVKCFCRKGILQFNRPEGLWLSQEEAIKLSVLSLCSVSCQESQAGSSWKYNRCYFKLPHSGDAAAFSLAPSTGKDSKHWFT